MEAEGVTIEGGAPVPEGMANLIEELGKPGFGEIERLFTDDVAAEDWMAPGLIIREREPLTEKFFDPIREAFPDVVFNVTRALHSAGNLIICGFFEGTMEGGYFGFDARSSVCRWEARDIYRFRDGRIDYIWFANDTLTVARELGARIEDERLW